MLENNKAYSFPTSFKEKSNIKRASLLPIPATEIGINDIKTEKELIARIYKEEKFKFKTLQIYNTWIIEIICPNTVIIKHVIISRRFWLVNIFFIDNIILDNRKFLILKFLKNSFFKKKLEFIIIMQTNINIRVNNEERNKLLYLIWKQLKIAMIKIIKKSRNLSIITEEEASIRLILVLFLK